MGDERQIRIARQIQGCMDKEPDAANAQPSAAALDLENILGRNELGLWWRLYINPSDQEEAFKKYPGNPGSLYDNQQSKGYQVAMTESYQTHLQAWPGVNVMTLDWAGYKSLFDSVTRAMDPNKYYPREKKEDSVSFGSSRELAQDTLNEIIAGRPLVASVVQSNNPDYKNCLTLHHGGSSGIVITTNVYGEALHNSVDAVFHDVQADMNAAATRLAQLSAIARCIRDLHILHGFSDGNGRLHVYLLLPMLLLRFGFGLPLGGINQGAVDLNALNEMFNGGYSIQQMAEFLWISQDFGLQNRAAGKRTVIDVTYSP